MTKQRIIQGDSAKVLKKLPDNSIDSLITDPPAGLTNQDAFATSWMNKVAINVVKMVK